MNIPNPFKKILSFTANSLQKIDLKRHKKMLLNEALYFVHENQ